MICIYHRNDLDGQCSAAIVKHRFPDCNLYPIDYPDKFEIESIQKSDDVIMVDFTFADPDIMKKLIDDSKTFTWIDHHKTAIDLEFKLNTSNIYGVRAISKNQEDPLGEIPGNRISACELTWEYFFPKRFLPYSVLLLGRYDIWDINNPLWATQIIPFQYGMRLYDSRPDNQNFWYPHFISYETNCEIKQIIYEGEIVLKYDSNLNKRIVKSLWFPIEFKGLKFQAINKSHSNTLSAKSIWNSKEFDAIMYFSKGPDFWVISMYTDKNGIDLYPIAKSLGGGGHNQACGFTVKNIMDVLPQLIVF